MSENEKQSHDDYKLIIKLSEIIGKKLHKRNIPRVIGVMLGINYKLAKAIGSHVSEPDKLGKDYVESINKAILKGFSDIMMTSEM